MTNEELTELVGKLTKNVDRLMEAMKMSRQITELNSQRLTNIENYLFNLFPKKDETIHSEQRG